MSHRRGAIREGFKALLTGKTDAADRVLSHRVRAILEDEMPALNVYTGDESVRIFNEAPRMYERTLQVIVEGFVRAADDIELDLERLLSQVEMTIDSEDLFELQPIIAEINLDSTSLTLQGDGSLLSGVAIARYNVIYYTGAGARADMLEPFEGINADWDGRAKDTITFPP